MVPVLVPAIDVSWLPNVTRKMIYIVQDDYRRYCGVIDNCSCFPSDVRALIVGDFADVIEQAALLRLLVALSFRPMSVRPLLRLCSGFCRLFRRQIASSLTSYRVLLLIFSGHVLLL